MNRWSIKIFVAALAIGCALVAGGEQASRVRVLLVRNKEGQHAIEEAAELSLDSATAGITSRPQDVSSRNNLTATTAARTATIRATDNEETGNVSHLLNYRQVSLASLTLHQRSNNETARKHRLGTNSNPSQGPVAPVTNLKQQLLAAHSEPWQELNLPRHTPSWLNVSSRFKITGASIDEIEYMFPPEYMLRQAFDSPVLLRTRLGLLEGVRSIKFNKHLYTFLGVPYAKPPLEHLRFKAPQPIESWPGIMQATKWPPFCVQPSMTLASKSSPVHVLTQIMTEDCLYLNIWTPSLKFNRNHKRPVMVWIHGGAFQYGGISVDENDGSALALAGDVVVVTLNYRISAFGFLNANNPKEAPNNVGLLDQQLALQWVQENIKQFGGDPQQVTLFGESAGGHSVGLHMISPKSQPLFKRAILQSGVPTSYLRSYDVNSDNEGALVGDGVSSIMMAKRLKCYKETTTTDNTNGIATASGDSEDSTTETKENESGGTNGQEDEAEGPILSDASIDCMRGVSSLEILKAMGVQGNSGFFPTGDDPKGFFPSGPIMDSFDADNLKVGPQKDYLIGTNTDEGTFMLHYGMPSLFPARDVPRVGSLDALKATLKEEIDRSTKLVEEEERENGKNTTRSEIQSASGNQNRGAQAHLYKPLLRTSSSLLESVMPKSRVHIHPNGTVTGNSTVYSKEAEFGKSVGSLITDIIFLCPARTLARTLSAAGRNVYFYLYGHRSSLSQYHNWIGVTHHDEVEFVFGRPLRLADVYSGKDIEMSQRIIKTWSHFAYTGQALDQLGVKWPKYGEDENIYMNLASNTAFTGERYHDKFCNIYETVISVHIQGN